MLVKTVEIRSSTRSPQDGLTRSFLSVRGDSYRQGTSRENYFLLCFEMSGLCSRVKALESIVWNVRHSLLSLLSLLQDGHSPPFTRSPVPARTRTTTRIILFSFRTSLILLLERASLRVCLRPTAARLPADVSEQQLEDISWITVSIFFIPSFILEDHTRRSKPWNTNTKNNNTNTYRREQSDLIRAFKISLFIFISVNISASFNFFLAPVLFWGIWCGVI